MTRIPSSKTTATSKSSPSLSGPVTVQSEARPPPLARMFFALASAQQTSSRDAPHSTASRAACFVKTSRLAFARPRTAQSAASGSIYARLGQFVLIPENVNLDVGACSHGRRGCFVCIPLHRPSSMPARSIAFRKALLTRPHSSWERSPLRWRSRGSCSCSISQPRKPCGPGRDAARHRDSDPSPQETPTTNSTSPCRLPRPPRNRTRPLPFCRQSPPSGNYGSAAFATASSRLFGNRRPVKFSRTFA